MLLVLSTRKFPKLPFSKYRERGLIFNTSSRLVVKGPLCVAGDGSKDFHDRYVVGARVRTLAATDTGRTHMGQAGQMIEDRVCGHLYDAFAIGPP